MGRTPGSKNKVSDETSETLVSPDSTLLMLITALVANPNVYPKHGDAVIIEMARRMLKEIEK